MAVIVCGGLILALCLGVRHGFGLFLQPMTTEHGWGRETFSFAIAIQNLMWGITQPFFGMIADRFGVGRVLVVGTAFYVAGLLLMPWSTTGTQLDLSAGILIGLGLGGTGFGVVYGAICRSVPAAKQSVALGAAGALGSLGQFLLTPYSQTLISSIGWARALVVLAATSGLMAPLAIALVTPPDTAGTRPRSAPSLRRALEEAFGHKGFWLLNLGFVVCGFQLAFITNHLPAFLADNGLSVETGMTALAIIGATNILGTYLCGYLGGRLRRKYLLSGVYFLRTSATLVYISLPVTPVSTVVYAVAMGLTWLGTAPLTTGVLSQIFGVQYLATLFGFVFLGHQLGGFFGVWLAGHIFDTTHSYQVIWLICIALGLLSTVVHAPIDDRAIELRSAVKQTGS